ncbi:MAG: phosphonate metabolism protein/1,5-bisphosphokinase (PRPP-forming) PhnN, partial [Candidatus Thorarchaeota archaeon]
LFIYMRKNFPGFLILVIGNSGSGKDSIIKGVIEKYSQETPKIHIVQRYITRPPSEFEENLAITPKVFKDMDKKHKFALKWKIYGLYYGIPSEIDNWLENGDLVLVNVSRKIINQARKNYENVKVVFIQVPFELSVQRLTKRGRESNKKLKERLERARKNQSFPTADTVINNSGKLDDAINQFKKYLDALILNKN